MVIAADYPLLNIIWTMFAFFGFVLWFSLLLKVFGDLFRRDDLSGGGKFGWSLLLIVAPLIGALAYLISQGAGLAQRDFEERIAQKEAFDEYIRETVASGGAATPSAPSTTKP